MYTGMLVNTCALGVVYIIRIHIDHPWSVVTPYPVARPLRPHTKLVLRGLTLSLSMSLHDKWVTGESEDCGWFQCKSGQRSKVMELSIMQNVMVSFVLLKYSNFT